MFASRLPSSLSTNPVTEALVACRTRGIEPVDLTTTNPTAVGLVYPPDVLSALSSAEGLRYRPEALGLPVARHAVANEASQGSQAIDPGQVVLTASTSEAYSLLFKLLCDAGDDVLVPEPSYPLFDLLTRLDHVATTAYPLDYHGLWSINRPALEAACTPRTRAILVVSPNNPTGSRLRHADREWLVAFAFARGLALISDEVFIDFPIEPRADASSLLGERRVLTFTLGGLSKSAGLPQVKLGWIVVSGPPAEAAQALARLEIIADTYLSVSTPVQVAAPVLLEQGRNIRREIQARIGANYATVVRAVSAAPQVQVLPPEGGWSCVLRVPSHDTEDALVMRLLNEHHILVHPGYFFDMPQGTHLVISLLPEPSALSPAVTRILEVCA